MSVYASYCARHVAESKELPKGRKYGWPASLDSRDLANRVQTLKQALKRLVNDPDEGCFFRPLEDYAYKYGKGAITGAKGSWLTFDKATTG